MLTFLIVVVLAALACWGIETYCKMGNSDPTNPDEFTRDWQAIKNEATTTVDGIKRLGEIGWPILIPIGSLIGLIGLVWWALSQSH